MAIVVLAGLAFYGVPSGMVSGVFKPPPTGPQAPAAPAAPAPAPAVSEPQALADSPSALSELQRAFECYGSDFDVARMTMLREDGEYVEFATPGGLKLFGLTPRRISMASGLTSEFDAPLEQVSAAVLRRHPGITLSQRDTADGPVYDFVPSGGPPSSIFRQGGSTRIQCGG